MSLAETRPEFESIDGAVVRALASHQCDASSNSACCHIWVEFVVGSILVPPSTKTNTPSSNSTRIEDLYETSYKG